MAVGGVLVFEGGPGLAYDAVIERLESRLHLIPRYRQRLAQPARGITNPVWVDDKDFHAEWHVHHATAADPARLVGNEMSRKLDRSRPPWEMTVVDRLKGEAAGGEATHKGHVALVPKMHHSLVDGVAAVDVGTVILDPTPEPMDLSPDSPWQPEPYDRRRHLAKLATQPMFSAQRLFLQGAERAMTADPVRAAGDLRRATELLVQLARTRPQAPMTFLNKGIGPNRRFASARASLADLKAAAKAAGGTVNDAILAAVAGMLGRLFEELAERPPRAPVALVPVSVRQPGEEGGNRISTVLVDLPAHDASPAERIGEVNRAMTALKDSAAVRAGSVLVGAGGWAPPLISSMLARAMGGVRAFNLVVSNIPGPQQPFYMNGSRLLEVYPVVPLNPASQGLTVGVLSYDGAVHFGLLADRGLTPPVEDARAALVEALSEITHGSSLDAGRS